MNTKKNKKLFALLALQLYRWRSAIFVYALKSNSYDKNSKKLSAEFFPEPRKSGRSVEMAFESLTRQGFHLPRVRTIASIRED